MGAENLALDTASGAQLWSKPELGALALTTGNGQVYVVNEQCAVEALGSRTGDTLWHTPDPVAGPADETVAASLALSVSASLLAVPLWTATCDPSAENPPSRD